MRLRLALVLSLCGHLLLMAASSVVFSQGNKRAVAPALRVQLAPALPIAGRALGRKAGEASRQLPAALRPAVEQGSVRDLQPSSQGQSAPLNESYWPFDLLSEPPQALADPEIDVPEIRVLLDGRRVSLFLMLDSQGHVQAVIFIGLGDSPEETLLQQMLRERFIQTQFSPAKVNGMPVATLVPIAVSVGEVFVAQ